MIISQDSCSESTTRYQAYTAYNFDLIRKRGALVIIRKRTYVDRCSLRRLSHLPVHLKLVEIGLLSPSRSLEVYKLEFWAILALNTHRTLIMMLMVFIVVCPNQTAPSCLYSLSLSLATVCVCVRVGVCYWE